jgi:hypothetical protein
LTLHFYRVNFEVRNPKPFPHLAFPHFATPENSSKQLGFDGELMASFLPFFQPSHGIVSKLPTIHPEPRQPGSIPLNDFVPNGRDLLLKRSDNVLGR